METHRHAHTERKRWNHYVWEFLMLFLAVFAGFIAENLRENIVERRKEKQYIESLVDDLKNDTLTIRRTSRINLKLTLGQDSLIDLLNDFKDTGNTTRLAYGYYFSYTIGFPQAEFSERTMSQLLNAGNMRLIEKPGISDSIMDYDILIKYVKEQGKATEEYFKKTLDLSLSVFDFSFARANMHDDFRLSPKIQKAEKRLLTTDPGMLKRYAVSLSLYKAIVQQYIVNLKQAKDKAVALIALLKKEYHLRE